MQTYVEPDVQVLASELVVFGEVLLSITAIKAGERAVDCLMFDLRDVERAVQLQFNMDLRDARKLRDAIDKTLAALNQGARGAKDAPITSFPPNWKISAT